jgi:hypothetical protein
MGAGFSLAFTLAATIDLMGPTGRHLFTCGDALLTLLILWMACVGLTRLARRAGSFVRGEKGTPAATAGLPSAVRP